MGLMIKNPVQKLTIGIGPKDVKRDLSLWNEFNLSSPQFSFSVNSHWTNTWLSYSESWKRVPTYLSIFQPTFLSIYLLTFLPTYLPTYLPSYLSTYLHSYIFIHPSIYLPTFLPIYLPTFLYICLSSYLFIYLPTLCLNTQTCKCVKGREREREREQKDNPKDDISVVWLEYWIVENVMTFILEKKVLILFIEECFQNQKIFGF